MTARTADRREHVDALLHPESVGIVGANDRAGAWPERIRFNLRRFGFTGTIYPINPRRTRLWDGPCYPSAADLPEPADHLVVLVPAAAAVEAVRAGARAGSRSATIFSGGFTEGQLDELRELADETGMAISGPNCLGNVSAAVPLVTTTDIRIDRIEDGNIAVVGQSGGVVTALQRAFLARGIGVRYMVSSGNETVLSTADYVRYFAHDDGIRVVVAFVESLRERTAFFGAADELARRGKRLVCLKVGRSAASRTAAASHTGALAGSYDAFRAVARGHGIVTVPTLESAVEAGEFLSRVPAPDDGGLAVVTVSGGVRELALDSAASHRVRLAGLGRDATDAIGRVIGQEMEVSNPLDSGYAGLSDPGNLVACAEAMAADPEVTMVLVQEELLGVSAPNKEKAIALFDESFPHGRTKGTRVPVALFSMTTTNVTEFGRAIRRRHPNLAFVQGIEGAMMLSRALQDGAPRPGEVRGEDRAARARARALLAEAGDALDEVEAKRVLGAYGIPHPPEALVATPDDAAAWAGRNGPGPFVVKAVIRGVNHKSESGGVRLGLGDPAAVKEAATAIGVSHTRLEGFLVAQQVSGGVEVIVGFHNDREVGPVVAVGLGGTAVELLGDVRLLRPNCTRAEAEAALDETAAGRMLAGFRNGPRGDRDAVVDAIQAIGRLASDLGDELESAEVNPLLVLGPGQGVTALDALCVRQGRSRTDQ